MASLSSRRARTAVLALGAAVLAAGVIGTWALAEHDDGGNGCATLLKDARIRSALGSSYKSELTCDALGREMKARALGDKPGVHSMKQAQAMRDILSAANDAIDKRGYQALDRSLSMPLAQLLADYVPDTHEILKNLDADYVKHVFEKEPWEDESGVHMAVSHDDLVRVMRAVSATPSAYATIRTVEGRHAAAELAGIPAGATGYDLSAPAAGDSLALGALDGIATSVVSSLSKGDAEGWESRVKNSLSSTAPREIPVYRDDPVGYVADSWNKVLKNSSEGLLLTLREQNIDYLHIWAKGRGGFKLPADLVSDCQDSADRKYSETVELLKKG
jgi:hypothetical protein